MSRKPFTARHALFALLLGLLAFLSVVVVREPAARDFFRPSFLAEWYRVGLVMRVVNTRYLDPQAAPYAHLARNAAAGAAAKLDRYSEYLDAEDYDRQNKHSEQLFTGIGVTMRPVDGLICVERAMPGGGAQAAGIRAGDRILAADDTDLTGASLDLAASKIKGGENTTVTLTVRRPGEPEPLKFTVTRRTIPVSTVSEARLLADAHTAYIAVSGFERRTPDEIHVALNPLLTAGADALILDLRGNPGGLVDAAVGAVGLFCPKDTLVVSLVGRGADDNRSYRTPAPPRHPDLPLIVLVDGHSASASEIFAGAVRDHRRGVLVGARTFGKGLVQSIYQLDDTTGLKLTTARYTLPKGSMIHGVGVAPDVPVAAPFAEGLRTITEEAQLAHGGTREDFARRFGYTPSGDATVRTALALLDAARAAKPARMP